MAKVLEFPAHAIAKGIHSYTPEMGQRKPNCEMRVSLSHYGNHYFIDTKVELKGRGINFIKTYRSEDLTPGGQYLVGYHGYKVTSAAFEKLKQQYSISMERNLD